MSVPKFYVGQRVVAIENHPQGAFKRGDVFTVESVSRSACSCGHFRVTIGISTTALEQQCFKCGLEYLAIGKMYFNESRFAPIHEDFKKVTFERVVEKELTSAN